MLSFLKPWRELQELKDDTERWESAFNLYMETASQRDRDVISGCQYFYDSKNPARNRDVEEEIKRNNDVPVEDEDDREFEDENCDESTITSVSEKC
jgi:hypothetical protein